MLHPHVMVKKQGALPLKLQQLGSCWVPGGVAKAPPFLLRCSLHQEGETKRRSGYHASNRHPLLT